jgi:hypothetical protein
VDHKLKGGFATFSLMSFEGMGKSIRRIKGATIITTRHPPLAHHSDEFPAGYSSTGCSPALPVSASPAGTDYVHRLPKSGPFERNETTNRLL